MAEFQRRFFIDQVIQGDDKKEKLEDKRWTCFAIPGDERKQTIRISMNTMWKVRNGMGIFEVSQHSSIYTCTYLKRGEMFSTVEDWLATAAFQKSTCTVVLKRTKAVVLWSLRGGWTTMRQCWRP